MNRFDRIQSLVQEHLKPLHFELENESSQHAVPVGSESHFKILVVSELFQDQSRVDRQKKVYGLLDQEFKSGLHALSLRALTPAEWQQQGVAGFISPDCNSKTKAAKDH